MLGALKDVPAHDFHNPPSEYYREGSGEDRVQVPNVVGLSVSAARSRLAAAGFSVNTGGSVASDTYPRGTVARTSPGGGARVQPGATVTIYVSKGRPNRPGPPGIPPPPGGPPTGGPPTFPPPTFPPIGNTTDPTPARPTND
jgi:hypothetical protein